MSIYVIDIAVFFPDVKLINTMEYFFVKVIQDYICLSRPYPFKFFEDCLPQILFGPFLNTWTYLINGEVNHNSSVTKVLGVISEKTKMYY